MEKSEGLPSHHYFFTSLISSLSNRPAAPPPPLQDRLNTGNDNDDGTNKEECNDAEEEDALSMDLNRRKLLLTLHVLFPSLLLPALDLLDRNLVTKVCLLEARDAPEDSDVSQDGSAGTAAALLAPLYVVRSMASTINSSKRRRPMTGQQQQQQQQQQQHPRDSAAAAPSYVVRLASWNCTCAGFTFDAFPPASSSARGGTSAATRFDHPNGHSCGAPDDGWLGGLSIDGMTENAPCCKHLLACLLTENRVISQKAYLQTRHVRKDELAGLVAGM